MARRNKPTDVFKFLDMSGGPNACWLWKGSINERGIPQFTLNGRKRAAYRVTYKLVHPEWDDTNPRDMLRHQCKDMDGRAIDNPLCCNPSHVEPGTHQENMVDMMLRGRSGLTLDMLQDIMDIKKNHPELTHSQIAARVTGKHNVQVARQTVTDILSKRRRAVAQEMLDERERKLKEMNDGTQEVDSGRAQGSERAHEEEVSRG